ncbi:MAG: 7-cyano-7-deazaguanine synthase [Anaerolineae bacterium]|nr:7-cyano-7-deazaguanine synthase [Anaerolineae bacterium]
MLAIALLSGGLDSTLAVKLILDQGIEVEALNFVTPFCTCNRKGRCEARHVAEEFGIPWKTIAITEEFFRVIREPRYGYGSGMNPCLNCRILMFSRARERRCSRGRFFLSSEDYLHDRGLTTFGQIRLTISSYTNDVNRTDPAGVLYSPGSGLGPYNLMPPNGWPGDLYTDDVVKRSG